jgi:hypothetical protein
MRKLSPSTKTFLPLIVIYAVLAGITIFLPQAAGTPMPPPESYPAPMPVIALANGLGVLVIYGGLGLLGLFLSRKLGFPEIWDAAVTNRQRFLIPGLVGVGLGIFFIVGDLIFRRFNSFGRLPHPPFPTSLVASLAAGIGEETIFRLFFISFWTWLISYVILRKRSQNLVFWIVTLFSALAFAMGHLPSLMYLYNLTSISQVPMTLIVEIILLNGVISFFAAYYFHKYGFLGAVGVHFWADVVWHVIFGAF